MLEQLAAAIEGQHQGLGSLRPVAHYQPDPIPTPVAGAGQDGFAADPKLPRRLARLHQLKGAPVVGPVTHQQGAAAHGAETAELPTARQQLAPAGLARQVVQGEAFKLRHHHPASLGEQLHGARSRVGQGPLAPLGGTHTGAPRIQGGGGRLHQQVAASVAAQVGKQQGCVV